MLRFTTELLDNAKLPGLPVVNPDGTAVAIDGDAPGQPRDHAKPTPGPSENLKGLPLKFEHCRIGAATTQHA